MLKEGRKNPKRSLGTEIPGRADFIISTFIWVVKRNHPTVLEGQDNGNMSFQYHPEGRFSTGVGKLFCKGPNSTCLRLRGPVISVTTTQLYRDGTWAAIGREWVSVAVLQKDTMKTSTEPDLTHRLVCRLCFHMFTQGLLNFLDE